MRPEIDIPLILSLFIASLMCIPGQDVVTVNYTGEVINYGERVAVKGSATLHKPAGETLKGTGTIEAADGGDGKFSFEISENTLKVEAPDGSVSSESLEAFASVSSAGDYMVVADDALLNGRGQHVIVQEFPGYTLETMHIKGGGQLQLVHTVDDAGNRFVRAATWTIEEGVALHLTFTNISFKEKHSLFGVEVGGK